MKDIFKEQILYYIAAPLIIALWPLIVGMYYIPNIDQKWQEEKDTYLQAQKHMDSILKIDPGRLAYKDKNRDMEFDYAVAIVNVNKKHGINPQNCDISSKPIRESKGRKTRNCQVIINKVDIVKLANFLSDLQITWANLQAEKITLTKLQELPDSWKTDITFTYYY